VTNTNVPRGTLLGHTYYPLLRWVLAMCVYVFILYFAVGILTYTMML
jgi:hypothetical protein